MTYFIAWILIGFTCSILASTYNTKEVFEYRVDVYLKRTNKTKADFPPEFTYEAYKMFCLILGTLYGAFSIIGFYRIRWYYLKTKK